MARSKALSRDELQRSVAGYLAALDRLSVDEVMQFFADSASFIVQTDDIEVEGVCAIESLWGSFFATHRSMSHDVSRVIVDVQTRRAAAEVVFVGLLHDGREEHRRSSYHFEFASDGRFSRVIVWIDGETPESAKG